MISISKNLFYVLGFFHSTSLICYWYWVLLIISKSSTGKILQTTKFPSGLLSIVYTEPIEFLLFNYKCSMKILSKKCCKKNIWFNLWNAKWSSLWEKFVYRRLIPIVGLFFAKLHAYFLAFQKLISLFMGKKVAHTPPNTAFES